MNARQYWLLFLDTGAPEAYLMYQEAKRLENVHVSDNQGIGSAGNGLQ